MCTCTCRIDVLGTARLSKALEYRRPRNFGDEKIWRNLPKCYPLNFDELYFGDLQSWSTYDVTLSATCDVCLALRG